MSIKKIAVLAVAGLSTLFAVSANAQSYGDSRRENFQERSIEQGYRSGALTRQEASRLQSQEHRIDRMEYRAGRDGHISGREAARIDHARDRLGSQIYRQSHDNQTRYNGGWGRNYGGWGHRYNSYNRFSHR